MSPEAVWTRGPVCMQVICTCYAHVMYVNAKHMSLYICVCVCVYMMI